jgi:hypothetical protein
MYYESEPGRRSAAKLLSEVEVRRIDVVPLRHNRQSAIA